jgi:hypothetical protein
MKRIFGGGGADGPAAHDTELARLVHGATLPPHVVHGPGSSRPYSAPIQFATADIARRCDSNPLLYVYACL